MTQRNSSEPKNAIGTDSSTAIGIIQLSYCATKNRYMKSSASEKMIIVIFSDKPPPSSTGLFAAFS